jgi:hypothetical protein
MALPEKKQTATRAHRQPQRLSQQGSATPKAGKIKAAPPQPQIYLHHSPIRI